MDDNGHGTHVSGTIGAAGNNGVGVVGVNWTVRMMPCKFLDASGSGSIDGAVTCLDFVKAMKDSGVKVIATNNSWGGPGFSQALSDAIQGQQQDGILFIAAAGNDAAEKFPRSGKYLVLRRLARGVGKDNSGAFIFSVWIENIFRKGIYMLDMNQHGGNQQSVTCLHAHISAGTHRFALTCSDRLA
jgi:subtilisin family serine protease